jgi:ribosome-associated protein
VPINKSGPVRAKKSSKKTGKSSTDVLGPTLKAKIKGVGPKKLPRAAPTQAAPTQSLSSNAAPNKAVAAVPNSAKLAAARTAALKKVVIGALDDMKALEIKVLDVRGLTDVADTMVIASGTSDRHVRSVAKNVVEKTKAAGFRPHGVEGQQDSDWVLIDLHEMIVHVMLPRTREFYGLEKLWDMTATKRAARA